MFAWTALLLLAALSCSSPGSASPSAAQPTTEMSVPEETPSSTTDAVPLPECAEVPCQGPLEPGTYRAEFFEHPVAYEFTVEDPGWTWYYSGNFRIVADDTPTDGLDRYSEGVYVVLFPVAASTTCVEEPEPGVGHTVNALADWLEQLPGLVVTGRSPVTLGGLRGVRMDLTVSPRWTKTCPFSEGMPAVPLVMRKSEFGGYHFAIVPGVSMRWFLLPWHGGVILVDIDESKGGMTRAELLEAATPIVESFGFSAP